MPVRVLLSKSTAFEVCRQKMCRFRLNRRPIRHIFHRFQNVPASCEHSLCHLASVEEATGYITLRAQILDTDKTHLAALPAMPPSSSNSSNAFLNANIVCVGTVNRKSPVLSSVRY